MANESKYRFLLIPPFRLPSDTKHVVQTVSMAPERPKEDRLMNHPMIAPLLEDVEWDLHPGVEATYGDWPVETREEFEYAAAARLPEIKDACISGKYNAIVMLGGGEPGFKAAREIGRDHGVVVVANAFSQMYLATMLGNMFSVIDVEGVHNMFYRDVIYGHRLQDRCASIRGIGFSLPRPGAEDKPKLHDSRKDALDGAHSVAVERAVEQAEAAIIEDGAEVITLGCSGVFWLQPFIKKGLAEKGWDVPVLEGYSSSIELAKLMINLGVNASGITYITDLPKRTLSKVFV